MSSRAGSEAHLTDAHQSVLFAGTATDAHLICYLDAVADCERGSGVSNDRKAALIEDLNDGLHAAIVAGTLTVPDAAAHAAAGYAHEMFDTDAVEYTWPWAHTHDRSRLVADVHLRAVERIIEDVADLAMYTRELDVRALNVKHDPAGFLARVDGFDGISPAAKLSYIHRLAGAHRKAAYEERPDRDDLYRADLAAIPAYLNDRDRQASLAAAALAMSHFAGWLDAVGADLPFEMWRTIVDSPEIRLAHSAVRRWLINATGEHPNARRLIDELWDTHAGTLGELRAAVVHLC